MITTQNRQALWTLFLDVQKLVLWIPAKFSIDEETRNLAKVLRLNFRVLNLYCVFVFFAVIVLSAITHWPGNWPSIQTFLIVLAAIQVFKSIPVFVYLLVVNRKSKPAGHIHASE
jgi:hypothetical protein